MSDELLLSVEDISFVPERKFVKGIRFQFIPKQLRGRNLHNLLEPALWDIIRRKVYRESKLKCDICSWPDRLECHEVWSFDLHHKVQRLVKLQALCEMCHATIHGRPSTMDDEYVDVMAHFSLANKCTTYYAKKSFQEAYAFMKKLECIPSLKWKFRVNHILKKYLKGENVEIPDIDSLFGQTSDRDSD